MEQWAAEFKHCRIFLDSGPSEGWAKTTTTPETIEKMQVIILGDRRVQVN